MTNRSLQLQHLDSKMKSYALLEKTPMPPTGWIKAIRLALGITAEQLGKKLGITRQGILDMERRERQATITLNALQETAKALDMKLVYGFIPQDGSLEALIDRKAKELAKEIVMRTSNTMKLEDQENSEKRIEKAIQERFNAIRNEMPKSLWD